MIISFPMKKLLNSVTLLGVDCVEIERLRLAADICQEHFEFADVKLLTSLPISGDKRIVHIEHLPTVAAYSKFMIADLDKFIETPHVLIIQHDGFILNPEAWNDEFLQFDYVGAPWLVRNVSVNRFGFPKELLGQYVVGNGGFSLRSKKLTSLCAKLAHDNVLSKFHPEDVAICVKNRSIFEDYGLLFAPVPLAKQFSFESMDNENDSWDGQFGFHGLNWTDISKWLNIHPEYKDRIINDVTGHKQRLLNESANRKI